MYYFYNCLFKATKLSVSPTANELLITFMKVSDSQQKNFD